MHDNGPSQPGQPSYGQPAEPGHNGQDPSQQPGRRVIEQPYGPPIIIEEPALPPTPPLAETVRAIPPMLPPQAPPGYGAPYQAGGQPQPFQQGFQTQAPSQGYPGYRNIPGAQGNYPAAGYSGGSFPPGGYPPQGGPRRGGMPPWAPIAGGIVVGLVLIAIIIAATRSPGPSPTVLKTSTPRATNTPALTGTMTLGSDWAKDASETIVISGAKSTFASSDSLAWVVNLDQDVGTLQAQVRCVHISTGGSQAVVYTETYDIGDATDVILAEKYNSAYTDAGGNPESAATVTKNGPSGTYRLEFVVNGTLRAAATFTYNA